MGISMQHISAINFRNKRTGWKNYSVAIDDTANNMRLIEPLHKNAFMKGFLKDLYLRPSCYRCPAKSSKSGSDITLADYWGIQNVLPEFDDDKGVSLVMVNTEKGKILYNILRLENRDTSYREALAGNSSIEKSVAAPVSRGVFFRRWNDEPLISLIRAFTHVSLVARIRRRIRRVFDTFYGRYFKRKSALPNRRCRGESIKQVAKINNG